MEGEINFDVNLCDTKLAEEYIKTKKEIHSIGYADNGSYEYDAFCNKIYLSNIDTEPEKFNYTKEHFSIRGKLLHLVKKIKKNADLFCQLELLTRGVPVEDVERCDVKLIINNLVYCYKAKRNFEIYNYAFCERLAFLSDTPLAVLGFVAQSLCCHHLKKTKTTTIISNKHTAVIASLFVDLCHEAGLVLVKLLLVSEDTDCSNYNLLKVTGLSTGCIAVVSNKSDVDSAIDAILSSTNFYPWRMNKIFIQESAMKRFNSAMKWKTRGGSGYDGACEVSYSRGEKLFLLEPGSVRDCTRRLVVLEAYRTVKELLRLVETAKPFAISLWCSDLAETNELAYKVDANIVWVNDFANFDGPAKSSQGFFSILDAYYSSRCINHVPELDRLNEIRESWIKSSAEEREIILREESLNIVFCTQLIDERDFQDSFVHVTDKGVVSGVTTPAGIWQIDFGNTLADTSCINFLMKGGGLLVKSIDETLKDYFTKILERVDAPIVCEQHKQESQTNSQVNILWKPCYKHKVIWTNHGTAFAN